MIKYHLGSSPVDLSKLAILLTDTFAVKQLHEHNVKLYIQHYAYITRKPS